MRRINVSGRAIFFVLAAAALLSACSETTSAPKTTAGPAIPGVDLERDAYTAAGCAACHGTDGEGDIGPPLAGHTREQVFRQVRSPIGIMPPFPPDDLSDDQLEAIVAFVDGLETLEQEHGHMSDEALSPGGVLQMHHFMALNALNASNFIDATHHVTHIVDLVEGAHLEAMRAVDGFIQSEEPHEARHLLEGMIVTQVSDDLTEEQLHIRLALQSVAIGEAEDARHHLEHALGVTTDEDAGPLIEVVELIEAGDLPAAAEHLRELTAEGAPSADDHEDDQEGDHEDGEEDHDSVGE